MQPTNSQGGEGRVEADEDALGLAEGPAAGAVAPRDGRNNQLRIAILEHAVRLFGRDGYAATSTRAIAEAVGCTKPAIYYYFASKEALFQAALEYERTQLDVRLMAEVVRTGDSRQRMTAGLADFFDQVRRAPERMRLMLRAELLPEPGQPPFDHAAALNNQLGMVEALIRRGIAEGSIRSDLNPRDGAVAIVGITRMHVTIFLDGGPLPDDAAERIVDLFYRGVGV